jgi:hypothetical protein
MHSFTDKKHNNLINTRDIIQGRIQGAPPPLKLEQNMIFWRKIVIFHTKYPTNFRVSLRSAHFFLSAPH